MPEATTSTGSPLYRRTNPIEIKLAIHWAGDLPSVEALMASVYLCCSGLMVVA